MREALNISPTKDNLLKYKRKLSLVEKAYDLLREKYDALLLKVHILSAEIGDLRVKLEKNLSKAYFEFIKTESELGRDMLNVFSETVPKDITIESTPIEYMGVLHLELEIENLPVPSYGFFGISSLLWVTARRFREVFRLLVQLAEIESFGYRIMTDLQSIQLNLNALDKIYRVRFQNIIKYIEDILESNELENFYIIKKLKQKIEQKNRTAR